MKIVHMRDVANVAENLVRALNDAGHSTELILFPESGEQNVFIKILYTLSKLPFVWRTNAHVRAGNYDIIHIHVANAGWIAKLGGYPYFIHCHGAEITHGLYQPIRSFIVRYTLEHALHVFYVTPDLQIPVCSIRPDATFLPNPVDTRFFSPDASFSFSHDPVRVFIAARLTCKKGPEIAYRAVELARRDLGDIPIEVGAFGFGKDVSQFQHLLGIPGIQYVPPRRHEKMPELYRGYDIIVGQTQAGALGMIELESMACGKPVVCFCDLDAYARHYDQIPPVFSAETAEGMAEHIKRLVLDSACRHSAGQQARDWVVKYHGMETVARLLESQYRQHLSQSAC